MSVFSLEQLDHIWKKAINDALTHKYELFERMGMAPMIKKNTYLERLSILNNRIAMRKPNVIRIGMIE